MADPKDRGGRRARPPRSENSRGGHSDRRDAHEPQRSSLSNVGGEVEYRGHDGFAHPLRTILEAVDKGPEPIKMHAFHTYPARMHPSIARQAVAEFSRDGRSVMLDPFCGGGTTILEAMRAGWRTLGSDLNPLAIDLTRVKGSRMPPDALDRFLESAQKVAEASEARVRERVDSRAKLSAEDRAWYEIHVLKELAGLLEEIDKVGHDDDRRALRMVFSAMAVKFSKQRSDTVREPVEKRLRKGLVTEFFVRKTGELAHAWMQLEQECTAKTLRPKVVRADVRRLGTTVSGDFKADLILTSPPYGGTYDYAEHHALRLAWLGHKSHAFREGELGSRRELAEMQEGAAAKWDAQVLEMLSSLAPRLSSRGVAVLLVGDGQVGGRRVCADTQLERLAPDAGMRFVGVASQRRPDYAGGATRSEHLIALEAI